MVEPVEPDPQLWERVKAKNSAGRPERAGQACGACPAGARPAGACRKPGIADCEPDHRAGRRTGGASDRRTGRPAGGTADPARAALLPPPLVVTELSPSPPPLPAEVVEPAPPPPAAASVMRADAVIRRRLARWRALALLMTLVVVAVAGLLAAWRFAPERVPPVLQPIELMRLVGVRLPTPEPPPPPPGAPAGIAIRRIARQRMVRS